MFDELKEIKYFKEITDFWSYNVKYLKEIKRLNSFKKAETYLELKRAFTMNILNGLVFLQ